MAPGGTRPAATSRRNVGSVRIGSFCEPSNAIWSSRCCMRGFANRSVSAARYAAMSLAGSVRCAEAASHHSSSQPRHVSSLIASATVTCPRSDPAYASIECAPLSSQSLRSSKGATSSVKVAPASSHRGRPVANAPLITHSVKGSVTTGAASWTPVRSATVATSSAVGSGVIRSTMVVAKPTVSTIHAARSGSTRSASSRTTRATAAPFSGRLSHGTTVSGPAPARRRAARPATSLAGAVRTSAVGSARSVSTSASTSARAVSRPPVEVRTYPASVTVVVTSRTSGEER